ncbi:hypothetical protein C5C57_12095 [Rathayibacter sp. AY1C5]|nr:hypothetical protein C5C57_12095 [Rathayibacter sp. AY1C5]
MSGVAVWPTREPGRPYRWLLDLETERVAPLCGEHQMRTDGLGVCPRCVVAWRQALGVEDPFRWTTCLVCGLPVHPAADVGNATCPMCELELDPGSAS